MNLRGEIEYYRGRVDGASINVGGDQGRRVAGWRIKGGELQEAMEANGGLVAGSHNRNELVVIRQTSDSEEVRFNCIPNFRNLAFSLISSRRIRNLQATQVGS